MKHPKVVFKMLLCAAIVVTSISCDNDEKEVTPSVPDGEALLENFDSNLEELTQHFTVNAAESSVITGKQGTRFRFYPESFLTQDNVQVTGNVDIEVIEIYSKADMLLTRKGTNGKTADGSIATLVSGGEFFVNATQGGKQLKLVNGFMIAAPVDNTGGADDEMRMFNGVEDCPQGTAGDCDFVWVEEKQQRMEIGQDGGAGGSTGQTVYMAFQSQFGWTNIDKWYSDPRPKTTIYVDVPDGYDNANCAVFLAYEGESNALAQFDVYDNTKGLFTEHYGLIPVGLKVHFILVSVVDGQWNYAIQSSTITENHKEEISNIKSISEEQLKALINGLP